MPRVLVLALDGATFDVLQPLIDEGRMPTLAKLLAEGTSARLRSTIPPVTAPAWVSFMTGKNPGKHGIYEFLYRQAGSLVNIPVNARLVGTEALWSILSRSEKSVGVINVPMTYPHKPVNGFMIGDFLTPAGATDYAFPLALLREVEERHGPYPLYHRQAYAPGRASQVLDELYEVHEYYRQVGLDLIRRPGWDFFMIHFAGIDRLQHELWHVIDETHPAHNAREAAAVRERTLNFFAQTDQTIHKLLEAVDDDPIVVVMSDHGFGPIYRFVNMNIWLLEQGYLRIKNSLFSRLRYTLFKLGITPAFFYRLAMRFGLASLRLARGMSNRVALLRIVEKFFLSMADIDWKRTRAYSQGNYGQIFINLAGREPEGTVLTEEYDALRKEIAGALRGLVEPSTGQALIEELYLRGDVYSGAYIDYAPDITFLLADGYKALGTLAFTANKLVVPVFGNSGDHRMDGILVMSGPAIRKAQEMEGANIVDLAPTILYTLGLPVQESMDGEVLLEALDADYVRQNPVTYADSLDETSFVRDETPYSEDEQAEIRDRLKNLGYWA